MNANLDDTLSQLSLQLPVTGQERIRQELEERINCMITQNFGDLVQALYRLDVDEQKVKAMLREHPATDAARILAALIIERHLQKLRTRAQFRASPDIPEEDAW